MPSAASSAPRERRLTWGGRILFGAALVLIFVLSLMPVPEGLMVFSWQDKVEHALAFLVLGLLGERARIGGMRYWSPLLLAYGALIELAQGQTAHRMADPFDWVADAVGVAMAAALVIAWRARRG